MSVLKIFCRKFLEQFLDQCTQVHTYMYTLQAVSPSHLRVRCSAMVKTEACYYVLYKHIYTHTYIQYYIICLLLGLFLLYYLSTIGELAYRNDIQMTHCLC